MHVENHQMPDTAQIALLQQPGPQQPIVMVNLLKFRARAHYPDGRDTHLTGREAYQRYAVRVATLIRDYGGRVLFAGDVTALTIGVAEPLWDEVALAEYPDRAALLRMSLSPEWRDAAVHRTAGLEGQLNIETVSSMAAMLGASV